MSTKKKKKEKKKWKSKWNHQQNEYQNVAKSEEGHKFQKQWTKYHKKSWNTSKMSSTMKKGAVVQISQLVSSLKLLYSKDMFQGSYSGHYLAAFIFEITNEDQSLHLQVIREQQYSTEMLSKYSDRIKWGQVWWQFTMNIDYAMMKVGLNLYEWNNIFPNEVMEIIREYAINMDQISNHKEYKKELYFEKPTDKKGDVSYYRDKNIELAASFLKCKTNAIKRFIGIIQAFIAEKCISL